MVVKAISVPLESEYLQSAAKELGLSRTKLVCVVMEKVVRDELVSVILTEDDVAKAKRPMPKYRRFKPSK
jgi:hypothetical protein